MSLLGDSISQIAASFLIAAALVAALVLGQNVLVPLAGAVILAFMLSPIVRWLVHLGVPQSLAVSAVLCGVLAIILAVFLLFSAELLSLTARLDDYRENIVEKIRSVTAMGSGNGLIGSAARSIDRIGQGISRELHLDVAGAGAVLQQSSPIEVRNVGTGSGVLAGLQRLVEPMSGIGLTFLFTLFLLLQHQDLRDRVVRILGTDYLSETTSAMSEAGERLSRLFLAQAIMNAGFAALAGLTLWFASVPGALVWGILSGLMRFIPFIGSVMAAVPPVIIAAGVTAGWGLAIFTAAFFIAGEIVMGNLVEPHVLGRRVGLSPFAMIVAASFWTLIWGPIGLLLSAPLTIVVVVIGRYLPGLSFLSILLGDEPALTPEQILYQRLLAGDATAVGQLLADAALTENAGAMADNLVMPALQLAGDDFRIHALSEAQAEAIETTMHEAMDEGGKVERAKSEETGAGTTILLIGARDRIDGITATYLARQIELGRECPTLVNGRSRGLTALAAAKAALKGAQPGSIVIVSSATIPASQAAYIAQRANQLFPKARIFLLLTRQDATGNDVITHIAAKVPDASIVRSVKELFALLRCEPSSSGGAVPIDPRAPGDLAPVAPVAA